MSSLDAGFSSNDAVNKSPWQPGTPPLTLLRLLGLPESLDNDPSRRSPPLSESDVRLLPHLVPPKNIGKANRSSSLSSSFFAGFSRPEVSRRQINGKDAFQASLRAQSDLSDAAVDGKPEVNDGPHLPHLQITPSGKQRWLSGDRDVTLSSTSAVDDVTNTTKTGNITYERHDSDLSTVSKASFSITLPTSLGNNNNSITAAPEVDSTSKDRVLESENTYDYDGQSKDGPDDDETHGEDPFHSARGKHLPVWPVPQHHMTLYPPGEQRPFGSPSRFDVFPRQHPIFGAMPVDTAVQAVDLSSLNGPSSANGNGVDGPASHTTHLQVLSPVNHVRTSPNKDWELGGNVDEATKRHESELNTEEERTTSTSTSQRSVTSAEETGSTAVVSENDADLPSNRPSAGDESTTTTSSSLPPVKTHLGVSNERGRVALWRPASWKYSAGVALTAGSFRLLGMCVCVLMTAAGWLARTACNRSIAVNSWLYSFHRPNDSNNVHLQPGTHYSRTVRRLPYLR